MEENILVSQPDFKLYKERSFFLGTIIGGPLVAGYMAAENFKHIGQKADQIKTWAIPYWPIS